MKKFPQFTVRRIQTPLQRKTLGWAVGVALSFSFTVAAATGWLASQTRPEHADDVLAEGGQWGNKGGRSVS